MIPHYLLTSTFYGNWLPGDPRGFVSSVRDKRPDEAATNTRHEHDQYRTPYDKNMHGLYRAALASMKGDVITISQEQAEALLKQFLETSSIRQ